MKEKYIQPLVKNKRKHSELEANEKYEPFYG